MDTQTKLGLSKL